MDTSSDFIRPEFLNILFFQQKNLVIFPYVDMKHLHGLEIFTAGYNVVDLECTALYNLKEILEFESTNSYSQNPTLYFIYNVNRDKAKELMNLEGIRCVINSNENISSLANGSRFIFFNKKNNQFLNYDIDDSDLEFEHYLISTSQDETLLQENIQKIKIVASRIFKELNHSGNLESLPDILIEYEKKYWNSILDFTRRYYDINIPEITNIKFKPRQVLKDFSDEYDIIITTNRQIGKEFVQLLHNFRSKRVNPAHLELEELYNPQKLYNYLRNHHWQNGIPEDFINEWNQMSISYYQLTESDQLDFERILKKLDIQQKSSLSKPDISEIKRTTKKITSEEIPSFNTEWNKYKQWIFKCLDDLERCSTSKIILSPEDYSYFLEEISELDTLLNKKEVIETKIKQEEKTFIQDPNKMMVVDLANILHQDRNENQELKVENIIKVHRAVFSMGYTPTMIADASTKHKMDDKSLYEELIENGIVVQSPAGTKADEYVLEVAKAEKSKFLTNDLFREYWDEFGSDWIFQNRLTCLYVNGKFIIRENGKK